MTAQAQYGSDIATEADLRLLGEVRGRRILELGCGHAEASVSFAKRGAIAIAVDSSADYLASARRLCDAEEVRVELRHGDVADLAFLRADSIDVVFSANTFQLVADLDRVLRQVHRVLRVGAPLIFSVPHPAYDLIDADAEPPLLVRRSYFDRAGVTLGDADTQVTRYPRTFADFYMSLVRASYRVDLILEPAPSADGPRSPAYRDAMSVLPPTLIIRARKEGS